MKVLVDTSVWSLALRRRNSAPESEQTKAILTELVNDIRVQIIGPIRQELLTGIRDQAEFDKLKHRLGAFVDIPIGTKDYELAAEFANTCRRKGIQGSHTDFLICAVAANHRLAIFTNDKDFELYAKHLPVTLFHQ